MKYDVLNGAISDILRRLRALETRAVNQSSSKIIELEGKLAAADATIRAQDARLRAQDAVIATQKGRLDWLDANYFPGVNAGISNAQGTANDARSRADNAQGTANDARSRAIGAQGSADAAWNRASNAQATADAAAARAARIAAQVNAITDWIHAGSPSGARPPRTGV